MDPYELLQIPRDASPDLIRQAYRRRAFQTHPDRQPASDASEFRAVSAAYEQLSGSATGADSSSDSGAAAAAFMEYLADFTRAAVLAGSTPAELIDALITEGCPQKLATELESRLRPEVERAVFIQGQELTLQRTGMLGLAVLGGCTVFAVNETAGAFAFVALFLFASGPLVGGLMAGLVAWSTGRHPASIKDSDAKVLNWVVGGVFFGVLYLIGRAGERARAEYGTIASAAMGVPEPVIQAPWLRNLLLLATVAAIPVASIVLVRPRIPDDGREDGLVRALAWLLVALGAAGVVGVVIPWFALFAFYGGVRAVADVVPVPTAVLASAALLPSFLRSWRTRRRLQHLFG